MKHEEAVLLVPDLVKGALSGEEKLGIEEHMAGCEECRDQMTACRDLAGILSRADARARGTHPSSEAIVTFALYREDLPPEQAASVEAHVADCTMCRAEIGVVRTADSGIGEPLGARGAVAGRRFLSPFTRGPLFSLAAAAILVILAGVPMYLTYERAQGRAIRLDEAGRENERLRAEVEDLRSSAVKAAGRLAETSSGGPAALNLLRSNVRGAGALPKVAVGESDTFILLTIEPALPPGREAALRFEVRDANGRTAWSFETTHASLMPFIDASDGVLPLRIPASSLAPGRYELIESTASGEVLLRLSFEIVRP